MYFDTTDTNSTPSQGDAIIALLTAPFIGFLIVVFICTILWMIASKK